MKEKPANRTLFRFSMGFTLIFFVVFVVLSAMGFFCLLGTTQGVLDQFVAEARMEKRTERFSISMEDEAPAASSPSPAERPGTDLESFVRRNLHTAALLFTAGFLCLLLCGGFLVSLGAFLERRKFLEASWGLIRGMEEIRRGNFTWRITGESLEHLAAAGRAFNEMAEGLERADRARKALVAIQIRNNTQWIGEARRRQRSLAMHKARLEEKVRARTSILESMNTALRSSLRSLERRTLEITQLNRLAESLQNAKGVDEAVSLVIRTCQQIFPSDAGVLAFLEPDGAVVMDGWGRDRPDPALCGAGDCDGKTATGERVEMCCSGGQGCEELCIPIRPREGSRAILRIRLRQMSDLYGRRQAARRALAGSVAGHLTASLTSLHLVERLRREAVTDPLTGLYNRRYMEETFRREFSRIRREGVSLSVILMDVDHFKTFNDTYGHEVGDMVLRGLAEILASDVRAEDVACRFGGEEFLLLMPGLAAEAALKRAEALRREVENASLQMEEMAALRVTMSLGVATFPGDGDTPQALILEADKAMYAAKMAGRNRVVAAAVL